MEKKNHLFDESINEKKERQRGKTKVEEEGMPISWKGILVAAVTILFAVSILLRLLLS